ncbi:AraC family transcriptional regulator [Sphingomonas sp.]|uniref:AraC family transcriptional regulator n=1 Tax=Sphingomonas sp. TaxID=28214 RepID=UPI001B22F390|nr:AraC family transcriptional regulator [Sphingomonas sp.]MBO9712854.1 AraC family transcriptional regulator [Sphingomonas sp.]
MTWARAATLRTYVELARNVGLDPYRMLAKVGIDASQLADPESRISAKALAQLLEDSAVTAKCPEFGVLLAEGRSFASLGPLTLLLEHQRTLRDAIETFIRYQGILGGTLLASLEEHQDSAIMRIQILSQLSYPPRQSMEYVVANCARALRSLGGEAWTPESVHLMHRTPVDPAPYRRVLGTRVEFESGFNGLVYTREALARVNPNADPGMADYARDYVETFLQDVEAPSVVERVRRALYMLLSSGRGTIDQVALHLGVGPRTLQRLLGTEGEKFSTVLNCVRRELVVRHLNNPAQPLGTIAELMGYSNLSSFTRWFTGEFGVSPGAWRNGAGVAASAVAPPALNDTGAIPLTAA